MGDTKLALMKEIVKIVERGLKHGRTATKVKNNENDLRRTLEEFRKLASKANMSAEQIEELQKIIEKMREARLKYDKIEWWYCCLAPFYQKKLEEADESIDDYISSQLEGQKSRDLLFTICQQQTKTVEQQAQILGIEDLENSLESTVELNAPLMKKLKDLIKDGDRVLNLNGVSGSGKSTLVKRLCLDKEVRGWFNDNILFFSLGSNIQSNEDLSVQIKDELRKKKNKDVLLVLDNVESVSEGIVQQFWSEISSNPKSKILMTSRFELPRLGTQVRMKLLDENDSITLLRHFVQPIGFNSYKFPEHHTLQQIVSGCGGFPIAIKIIGSHLGGKPNSFWQRLLKEWSRLGFFVIHDEELLPRLQNSLRVSKDYERIREFFMDLGLFPENQRIPVAALVDMWVEHYNQVEDGRDAMIYIYHLIAMNLADMVVERRIGSDEDDYYDNHFLTQHNLLRQLANKSSSQQEEEFERERLTIEIYGNDRPQSWLKQQRVAARILSISTDQKVTPGWCHIQAAQAEVLILDLKTEEYTLPEFIKEMKNLKVFIVINSGFRRSTVLKDLKLLGSLQTLKRIRLQQVSVPCLWELRNLLKLSFYRCEVKTAFENSFMQLSRAITKLVELNFEDCEDLVNLPAGICDIVTLRKLSISNCRRFTELPGDIGRLENLELLRISYCVDFGKLPEEIKQLQSLNFLDISHCPSLTKLPKDIGALQNLRNLYISNCSISELPDSVINLGNLQRVICDEKTRARWEVINVSNLYSHWM